MVTRLILTRNCDLALIWPTNLADGLTDRLPVLCFLLVSGSLAFAHFLRSFGLGPVSVSGVKGTCVLSGL